MIKYTLKKEYDETTRTILNSSEYFFVRYWSGNDYKTNVIREENDKRVIVVTFNLDIDVFMRMCEMLGKDSDLNFYEIKMDNK